MMYIKYTTTAATSTTTIILIIAYKHILLGFSALVLLYMFMLKRKLDTLIYTFSRCLNACTYCKTKHARGDLASYSIEELVGRAKQSFQGTVYVCFNLC